MFTEDMAQLEWKPIFRGMYSSPLKASEANQNSEARFVDI